MGCDLHSHVEVKTAQGGWREVPRLIEWGQYDETGPFQHRTYGVFGFLAGVRNYSAVKPICEPRGFPDDASEDVRADYYGWGGAHTPSWLLVSELLAVDYGSKVNDRRVTRQVAPRSFDGGCTGSPEEGEIKTLRDFLGVGFMADLDRLAVLESEGINRVVFWFDN